MTTETFKVTYVCFLDILGFKDLASNNTHEDLIKIYTELLQKTVDRTVNLWVKEEFQDFESNSSINSIVVSDSIMLWSNNIGVGSFIKMILTIHQLLSQAMQFGIPLRGGMSIGPLSVLQSEKNTTVFGQGLVRAHDLESKQDWSGCIIDEECINGVNYLLNHKSWKEKIKWAINKLFGKEEIRALKFEDIHFLTQYPAPLKSGTKELFWVVDWTKSMVEKENGDLEGTFIHFDNVVKAFGWHNKNDDDWAVHSKIRNTLDFWHSMIYVEGAELHDMPDNKEEALNKIEDLYKKSG